MLVRSFWDFLEMFDGLARPIGSRGKRRRGEMEREEEERDERGKRRVRSIQRATVV